MAKKSKNKSAGFRRSLRESLILSCTSSISARVTRFFESGFASPLINSAENTDKFFKRNITRRIENKVGLGRKVFKPARNAVAAFFARDRLFSFFIGLKNRFLASPLRTAGVFLITFGVYSAAIYILSRYVSKNGSMQPYDLAAAAISFLAGMLFLLFGEKSILSALGNSRITGSLLNSALGINASSLAPVEKGGTAIGLAFLAGSLCGVITFFFSPARVLLVLLIAVLTASIFNVPEFGLLLSVGMLSFAKASVLLPVIGVTAASYLFKVVRLKRNLRFGTADAIVVPVLVISAFFPSVYGGSTLTALCFIGIYFLAKNMICSERLIGQSLNLLCIGLSVGIALYLLGEFAVYIPLDGLRDAAAAMSAYTFDGSSWAFICIPTIPVALSRAAKQGSRFRGLAALAFILAFTVVNDDPLVYILDIIAVLVYFAFARKAIAGALLAAAMVLPSAAVIISDNVFSDGGYFSSFPSAFSNVLPGSDQPIARFFVILSAVLAAVAFVLAFQRIFYCHIKNHSRSEVRVLGAIVASAVMEVAVILCVDPFADVRSLAMLWFVFGLTGSAYRVYNRSNKGSEVYG